MIYERCRNEIQKRYDKQYNLEKAGRKKAKKQWNGGLGEALEG